MKRDFCQSKSNPQSNSKTCLVKEVNRLLFKMSTHIPLKDLDQQGGIVSRNGVLQQEGRGVPELNTESLAAPGRLLLCSVECHIINTALGLGNMDIIMYHCIFDRIPQYQL